MKEIVTDLTLLESPSEPLKFITEEGNKEDEVREIVADLKEVFDANDKIYALAAPQIGINKRVFGIRFDDKIKFFINPIITKKTGLVIAPETFVGLPDTEILIGRPQEITVVYYNDEFKYEDNKLLGPAARIFDQMCQLLDGVLPTELGLVSNVNEDGYIDDLTEDEIKEVQEVWKQYVKTKLKNMEDEINSDEEAAKYYKSLQFSESVINGRTQVLDTDAIEREKARKDFKRAQSREEFRNFVKGKRK